MADTPTPAAAAAPTPPTTDLAPREKVPLEFGTSPEQVEGAYRLAQMASRSELVPKAFRGKPDDCVVAFWLGKSVNMDPMQSLQNIAVINGRPGLWGKGRHGVCVVHPTFLDHDEWFEVDGQRCDGLKPDDWKKDTTAAVCTYKRRGRSPVTRRFTVAQAKKAALTSKEGTWQTYPDRMLQMRARTLAQDDMFPDVLIGLACAEVLMDIAPEDPVAPEQPRVVRRLSDGPRAVPAPAAAMPTITQPVSVLKVDDTGRVSFSDGTIVTATDADARELEKFIGTDHLLTITYESGVDNRLVSVALAD